MTIEVEELRKVSLGPNDVLVLTLPNDADMAAIRSAFDDLQGAFPDNRVLVLIAGTELEVFTP